MSKKVYYDVIVIGSGIGGLTAAAILARSGKKVLVLEKNPVPGGYAVGFTRNGFKFDASIHLLDGYCEGTLSYKILEKSGISDKVQFLKPQYLYRSIFPDHDLNIPQNKPDEFINILSKYFPEERVGLQQIFSAMSRVFFDTNRYFDSKTLWESGKSSFSSEYPDLFLYSNKTYKFMLDKYLRNEKLKSIISQLWMYIGSPPAELAAFFYSCIWHSYFCDGGVYPKGGSMSISEALAATIKDNESDLIFNNEVDELIIENDSAVGVKTKSGQCYMSEAIISNIDARSTFHNLIKDDHLVDDIRKRIENMEPSISILQVYLGVDPSIKNLNSVDYEIFVNPSYSIDDQFEASLNNDVSNTPFALTLYTNLNQNGLSSQSTSTVSIAMLSGYDFWKKLSSDEYNIKKDEFSKMLINRAEGVMPGLSNYIKTVEVATPVTMENYTGNYKGAIYGWSQKVSQSGIERLNQNSGIDNLYLASAWTHPGGGISSVSYAGEQVARKILEKY